MPLFPQKHIKEDPLSFFLLEKNKITLLAYEKMEEEWFVSEWFVSFRRQIFISSINNYLFNYQIVSSCLLIARSYYVATIGVNIETVQNTQWYRLLNTTEKPFNFTDIISYNG